MSEQSSHGKAIFLVAAVFVLGTALGGVSSYFILKRTVAASPAPLTDQQKHVRRVERLTNELSLTGEQQKRLDEILTELEAQYKAIHDGTVPQIDQARHETRNKIRAILTPEQKPKFEEFLRRIDEERAKAAQH